MSDTTDSADVSPVRDRGYGGGSGGVVGGARGRQAAAAAAAAASAAAVSADGSGVVSPPPPATSTSTSTSTPTGLPPKAPLTNPGSKGPGLYVAVIAHEDHFRSDGYRFTTYEVEVHHQGRKWTLHKRYSEFDNLRLAVRGRYPMTVDRFKFPNKSRFNTFSDHTKERRQSGFDDFLMLLSKQVPRPAELDEFLMLANCGEGAKINFQRPGAESFDMGEDGGAALQQDQQQPLQDHCHHHHHHGHHTRHCNSGAGGGGVDIGSGAGSRDSCSSCNSSMGGGGGGIGGGGSGGGGGMSGMDTFHMSNGLHSYLPGNPPFNGGGKVRTYSVDSVRSDDSVGTMNSCGSSTSTSTSHRKTPKFPPLVSRSSLSPPGNRAGKGGGGSGGTGRRYQNGMTGPASGRWLSPRAGSSGGGGGLPHIATDTNGGGGGGGARRGKGRNYAKSSGQQDMGSDGETALRLTGRRSKRRRSVNVARRAASWIDIWMRQSFSPMVLAFMVVLACVSVTVVSVYKVSGKAGLLTLSVATCVGLAIQHKGAIGRLLKDLGGVGNGSGHGSGGVGVGGVGGSGAGGGWASSRGGFGGSIGGYSGSWREGKG